MFVRLVHTGSRLYRLTSRLKPDPSPQGINSSSADTASLRRVSVTAIPRLLRGSWPRFGTKCQSGPPIRLSHVPPRDPEAYPLPYGGFDFGKHDLALTC